MNGNDNETVTTAHNTNKIRNVKYYNNKLIHGAKRHKKEAGSD